MASPTTTPKFTNSLAREKSPYLIQHQHNPVDWHAWGDTAFARAREENKPIFLSIGYSTCHWCHVMERESFENEAVAEFLNAHFVSIKVDREERPDVDKIYMTFVQATTGQGGWPLNVFLTPDLKPFFGGTYYPPESRFGRPGFRQLLEHIHELWNTRQEDILNSARQLHQQLEIAAKVSTPSTSPLTGDAIKAAGQKFKGAYDPRHGGFGGAPKFPQPSIPSLLLRYSKRYDDAEALRMVLRTCDRMAAGGIYDQLGGGFSRYSVDAEWLVPHFEKMLYDNAQLLNLYLDAFLTSGEQQHADIARGIVSYVLRDMTHPEGGFYSAEDADSEGHEGKFYCWTRSELEKLLTPEEFNVAVQHFGITEQGNFVDHSHPTPLQNQNVLSIVNPEVADEDRPLLASGKQKMLRARDQRVRPHLDDKVLASWNGMMLGALSRASVILDEPEYLAAAEKNLEFLKAKLWVKPEKKDEDASSRKETGTLYHRWRDGERDTAQLLEAHAFLLAGVVDLYEATVDPEQLQFAIDLAEAMIERFYDREEGGFFQSTRSADLIMRVKDDYDGAMPSANSVATLALLRLAAITERADLKGPAEATLRAFAGRMNDLPQAVPHMLQALDFWVDEPLRAVIAGGAGTGQARELLRAVHSVYSPNKVILGNRGPVEEFARTLPAEDGPVLHLCTGTSCLPPTSDPTEVPALLLR